MLVSKDVKVDETMLYCDMTSHLVSLYNIISNKIAL